MYRNICLIGLPFSGKTSLGKKLSNRCHLGFLETDKMIEYKCRGSLPKILEYTSPNEFLYKEEAIATTVDCYNTVISTGGSIVYSNESMKHFQTNLQCKVIHLDISYNIFKEKVDKICFQSRGILYVAGGMQNYKGKWGTGADFWSTEGELNGWKRHVL